MNAGPVATVVNGLVILHIKQNNTVISEKIYFFINLLFFLLKILLGFFLQEQKFEIFA